MALAWTVVQPDAQHATSASDKTLTWTSATLGAGEVIYVPVSANASGPILTVNAPSGGGLTWTQIVTADFAAQGIYIRAWRAVNASGQTATITQATTRVGGSGSLGVQGLLYRVSGNDTTTPTGLTDTHRATTDPLTSNTLLQLTGGTIAAGDGAMAVAGDWNANSITSFTWDEGTVTVDRSGTEAGQFTYGFTRTLLASSSTDLRAQFDVSANGDWSCGAWEVNAAAAGGTPSALPIRRRNPQLTYR